ncbi:MAG: helix-hairpin-helix domain-containing protein [bacterium]|nr:helix-hairpin-helix domain-containing protein [bacterium]
MKRFVLLILLLILFFPYLSSASQVIEDEDDILELLNCGEITYSQYLGLINLFNEKLNINKDNLFELQEIPKVSFLDIINILKYRDNYGEFNSISELKSILENKETFERIKPFIEVPKIKRKQLKLESRVYGSREISLHQEIQSFENLHLYYGKNISSYVSFQKDTESHRLEKIYLKLYKLGLFQNLALGDYKAKFGQGLIIWENFKGGALEIHSKNKRMNLTLIKNEDEEKGYLEGADLKILLFPKIDIGGTYLYNSDNKNKIFGGRINLNLSQSQFFIEVAKNKERYSYILGSRYISPSFSCYQYFKEYDSGFPNNYTYRFKVNDDGRKEYFWEFDYCLNKFWQIYGYYFQESNLVSILNDNTIFLKLFGKLSPKFDFNLSRELREKDTEKDKEKTEHTRLKLNFNLQPSFRTNIYFRYTQKPSQVDHYLKLDNIYKLTKNTKIKGEVKFQDTNVKKEGQKITTFNTTFEQNILSYFKYLLKYEHKKYSTDYNQEPKDNIKAQVEIKW